MDNQQESFDHGLFVGLFMGEGNVNARTKGLRFFNTDEEIINAYASLLLKFRIRFSITDRTLPSGKLYQCVGIYNWTEIKNLFKVLDLKMFTSRLDDFSPLIDAGDLKSSQTYTLGSAYAKGYIIGLLLGEGCFFINKSGKYYSPTIILKNTNHSIIDEFIDYLKMFNLAYHLGYQVRESPRKPIYTITIHGPKRITRFFKEIPPELFPARRNETLILKQFCDYSLDGTEFDQAAIVTLLNNSRYGRRR